MRWFALYLPQFHQTKENDEWWGEGFTEWTHVTAAKPLFKGHNQPIIPQNNNYYNLMDKKTVEWQTELMKQHGIDGFVYYHYYFTGKKLLEKPAENLIKWKDIDQPFFFCWANHTWYKAKNGQKKVLIEQTYGAQEDWEEHFSYLLPFFRDERYEKKDNKPVFMIFNPNFDEKKDIINYFEKRCIEEGFSGIYIIETFSDASKTKNFSAFERAVCEQTEKIYVREPAVSTFINNRKERFSPVKFFKKIARTLAYSGKISWVNKYSGNKLYKIMKNETPRGEKICHGAFFSWDNTPRHDVRGYIIKPPSKNAFFDYANSIKDDEFVFINAWNEWAEGMILEPTEKEGTRYLDWIKEFNETYQKEKK